MFFVTWIYWRVDLSGCLDVGLDYFSYLLALELVGKK
jgi:hypothetical protein